VRSGEKLILKPENGIFPAERMKMGFKHLKYINPHNFRHTRTRFAMKQSPQYLNATRQALGHKNIDTTFSSYGELSIYEQREVIGNVKVAKELDQPKT
jgi:integrase